jgi:hypothetical protein
LLQGLPGPTAPELWQALGLPGGTDRVGLMASAANISLNYLNQKHREAKPKPPTDS